MTLRASPAAIFWQGALFLALGIGVAFEWSIVVGLVAVPVVFLLICASYPRELRLTCDGLQFEGIVKAMPLFLSRRLVRWSDVGDFEVFSKATIDAVRFAQHGRRTKQMIRAVYKPAPSERVLSAPELAAVLNELRREALSGRWQGSE